MGLLARYLEEQGIPTTTIASIRDITARVKTPRAVFLDFPLGRPCGEAFNLEQQTAIVKAALSLLATVTEGGTIVDLPYQWTAHPRWKEFVYILEGKGAPYNSPPEAAVVGGS